MARKKNIKYNTTTSWLAPFTEAVAHIVPIEKLDAVKGYKVLKNKEASQQGQIIKHLDTNRYVITIKTQIYSQNGRCYINNYMNSILEVYAHELAHIIHWEHTAAHWKLQATIQTEFGNVLDRLQIEDVQRKF